MKKITRALALLILPFLILSSRVEAKIISGSNLEVAADEIIDDDLFIAGDNIKILGTVNGDIYAAGGMLKFAGVVAGDIIAAGGDITIEGEISEDVRVFAGNIRVSDAKIGGALTMGAGNVDVADSVEVGRTVLIGSGMSNFAATALRDVMIAGGNSNFSGQTMQDLYLAGEEAKIASDASVSGNLTYQTKRDLTAADKSRVAGTISQYEIDLPKNNPRMGQLKNFGQKGFNYGFKTFSLFSFSLISLLAIFLFGKYFAKVSAKITAKTGSSILIGILVLMSMMPLFIILLLSILAAPLAFIFLFVMSLMIFFSKAFVAMALGDKCLTALSKNKKSAKNSAKNSPYWSFLLGYLIIFILFNIPGLGWLIRFLTLVTGLGAMISVLFENRKSS